MRLRLVFSFIVLLALSANQPCSAKEAHAQHGSRPSAANSHANTKTAIPVETKSNGKIDGQVEATVPPPVLPRQGVTQQRNETINPSVKIVTPGNAAHGQAARTSTPAVRNAIGQPIIQPKNFVGTEQHVPPSQQSRGPVSASGLRGAPPAAPPAVSSGAVHANAPAVTVANAANRGSVNGAALIRPAAAPTGIGGAVRPKYGINGTAVQTKH
jgi:hypothetical protein